MEKQQPMVLLRRVFLLILLFSSTVNAQNSSTSNSGTLPTWLAYVTGGGLILLLLYYCFRSDGSFDNARAQALQAPLLGGQYDDNGQPIMRQDIADNDDDLESGEASWSCDVCDFKNKPSANDCVLCGTEKGFTLVQTTPSTAHRNRSSFLTTGSSNSSNINLEKSLSSELSFKRQRSFAIKRLNMLNARQRGARKRNEWTRIVKDGKRYWTRKTGSNTSTATKLESQPSLAFVAKLVSANSSTKLQEETEDESNNRLTFCEATNAPDLPTMAARGYEISSEDLEVLETVAAMPFKAKYSWFLEQTTALIKPWEEGHLKIKVHRDNILVESMEQILGIQRDHIHMPLRIEFLGEAGIDAGGLEREWFAELSEKLFDETVGLFMCAHVDSLAYVFNPNSGEASTDHLLYYRGAGRLIGRALLEGQFMKAHLALPVLKHLLGVPISFSDLEFVDADLYRNLKFIRENDGVENLALDFSVLNRTLAGENVVVDLKDGGRDIEVTDDNKDEYVLLRLRYAMLDSFSSQLQHLMSGIFEVIPQELILVFDYQELELLLCGVPTVNVSDWKANTDSSDDMTEEVLQWFWEIMEAFSDEERARMLQFATGSSRVPVQGFKALTSYDGRVCHFTLKAVPYPQNEFPRSHTCFNRIDLPLYTSKETMEEVMSLVINMEVTGFTDE